jgi:hypothetical protein
MGGVFILVTRFFPRGLAGIVEDVVPYVRRKIIAQLIRAKETLPTPIASLPVEQQPTN